ncbi:TRAP transporter small permease [Leisingera methylohalidivorans]|uniref:TRAP transporter small permease protein n=1 Tax=Leisingera methylohalidivorans DSM 14336 TaxID=999552 RepID=V9VYQ9_9RHOB|nr:TRAP transporter small permease [Leisingera methylohalidivorans]AHD02047.1 membrane protein [Leisingera methylohalidivorans DSM 14336]
MTTPGLRILHGAITTSMMVALGAIVALTFVDVLARQILGRPVYGAHDITEHLMALIVFLGLPLITLAGGHLTVDLFDKYLLRRALWPWHLLVSLLIAAVLSFLGLLMWQAANDAAQFSEMSMELNVPRASFYRFFALSAFVSAAAAVIRGWIDRGQILQPQ